MQCLDRCTCISLLQQLNEQGALVTPTELLLRDPALPLPFDSTKHAIIQGIKVRRPGWQLDELHVVPGCEGTCLLASVHRIFVWHQLHRAPWAMTPCTYVLLASLDQVNEHPAAITLACKWRTGCHLWRDSYRACLLLCPGHYLLGCWEVHHQIAPAKSHTDCYHEGPLLLVVIKPPCWPWTSAYCIEVGDAVAMPCTVSQEIGCVSCKHS